MYATYHWLKNATDGEDGGSQQLDNFEVERSSDNSGIEEQDATPDGTIVDQKTEKCIG